MVSEQLEQGTRVKDCQKVGQVKEWGWGGEKRRETLFPCSLPSPPLLFHFLALVPFFVWPKLKIPIPLSLFALKLNGDA